jgi:predicted amidohydrolase YtcJ
MGDVSRKHFLGLGAAATAAGLTTGCVSSGGTPIQPDLVVLNGNVLTQDDQNPVAEAFALKDERFVAVGSTADVRNLATPNTTVIDAAGATIVPGFIDAHSHPSGAGLNELRDVNTNLGSVSRIQAALRERAANTPPGEWVIGFMYDDTKQEEGRPLNRLDLDAVSTDHPIVVGHRGGHTGVYNSKAFETSGISEGTRDPFGGHFYRDENGDFTGKVAERARAYFDVPSGSTPEERARGVGAICQKMNASGLTSVHQAGTSRNDFMAYQTARAAGDLSLRVNLMARGGTFPTLHAAGMRTGFGDEWLRIGPVKFAADGSASERTMAMSTPYEGRPDDFGILTMTQDEIHEAVEEAHRGGWQVAIHANGDVTIDMVLNAYERVQEEYPRSDVRHRIEHCSLVNPELLRRIAAGGFIPAPFYTYAHYHGEKWIEYGEEKMEWMFAHKSFLDHGIMVAPASDHSPGPFEPLMALQSMVTRKDFAGRVWGPSQRVTLDQAMKICTMHGAYASHEEHVKGSITAGKLGDFVILAESPYDVDPDRIKEIQVVRTVVGGRTVYEV